MSTTRSISTLLDTIDESRQRIAALLDDWNHSERPYVTIAEELHREIDRLLTATLAVYGPTDAAR